MSGKYWGVYRIKKIGGEYIAPVFSFMYENWIKVAQLRVH
jgi:hypothetical protein